MKNSLSGLQVVSAEFVLGASEISQLPNLEYPEIAIFGRSNVGKSTFINRLTSRRNLARASKTPGRTKEINIFKVTLKAGSEPRLVFLADLPGYGYAKVGKAQARSLEILIEDYLDLRKTCACACVLIDCRREPQEEELFIQHELFKEGTPCLIVLTKADKLSKTEQKKRVALIASTFHLEASDILISGEGVPLAPVWNRIGYTTSLL